jgi:hypothetical protein
MAMQGIRQYILFHDKRHPVEMGAVEVESFLTHLATVRHVASAMQNQALSDSVFVPRCVGAGFAMAGEFRALEEAASFAGGAHRKYSLCCAMRVRTGSDWFDYPIVLYGAGIRLPS